MPTATSGAHGAAGAALAIIPAVTAFLERWLEGIGHTRASHVLQAFSSLRMSVDAELAERVRDELMGEAGLAEKAMFGGLAFLLDGNMAVGITSTGELMVRVGADGEGEALADPHARPFDMTGRPMKGWILVERAGIETEAELNAWVRQGVEFARGLPAKR